MNDRHRPSAGAFSSALATLFQFGAIGQWSDAELLERFATGPRGPETEAAFAMLVERHGRLVFNTCRRILGDENPAHDAFQATFLVLARKAGSVRVGHTLAPWLHGVSVRVARRARSIAARERSRTQTLGDIEPIDRSSPEADCQLADLRSEIDREVSRLPARYRSVVVLCYLEGLTQEQAAHRLRCPLGTVQSRLHRARERLRVRLSRRGLAPNAVEGLAFLAARSIDATAPVSLVASTQTAAAQIAAGLGIAGVVPATVVALLKPSLGGLIVKTTCWTGLLLVGVGVSTLGVGRLAATGPANGPPRPQTAKSDAPRAPASQAPAPKNSSIAEQFARLRDEFEALRDSAREEASKARTDAERSRILTRPALEEIRYAKLMIDLAETAPKDPAARDALIWVIHKPYRSDIGVNGDHFARAVELLLLHHADDPEVARATLDYDRVLTRRRDALLEGIYVHAQNHETRGLIRLALAQYLAKMARTATALKSRKDDSPLKTLALTNDGKGNVVRKEIWLPDDEQSYFFQIRLYDPDALRQKAVSLFKEVIHDYGDVPYITTTRRELEALMRGPEPKRNGKPLTAEARKRIEEILSKKKTLAEVAAAQLDKLEHLSAGQPAPEIDGADLQGKPLKLSDHRGKVVALVFWGSWCGPCVREVPHLRALVERHKDKPFAILGVDCDEDKQAGLKAVKDLQMTWPNWYDGAPGEGPIAQRYHVRSFPTVVIIDADGVIQLENARGPGLDKTVARLLEPLAPKNAKAKPAR